MQRSHAMRLRTDMVHPSSHLGVIHEAAAVCCARCWGGGRRALGRACSTADSKDSPDRLPLTDDFERGLSELGYVQGENISIEWRLAQGKFERLPELAVDLVRLNVDVIVAPSPAYIHRLTGTRGRSD